MPNIFGSVKKDAQKTVKKLQKENVELKKLRLPKFNYLISRLSDKALSCNLWMLVASILLCILIWVIICNLQKYGHWFWRKYPEHLSFSHPALFAILNVYLASKLEKITDIIFAAQSALAGLVFPIIIGFVSLLLPSGSSVRFKIYQNYSGAKLFGLSSVFLVFFIVIQYFCKPLVDEHVLAAWAVINLLWFDINILGIIYFIHQTFKFIVPEKQFDIVKCYAASIVWPADLLEFLKRELYQEYCNKHDSLSCVSKFGNQINLADDEYVLFDVRAKLLTYVLNKWKKLIESSAGEKAAPLIANLPSFSGYLRPRNSLVLSHRLKIKCWQKLLVKFAFVFAGQNNASNHITLDEVFSDFQAAILRSIEQRQFMNFKKTLGHLEEFNNLMFNAASSQEKGINYAVRYELSSKWAENYRDIVTVSVEMLYSNIEYFKRVVNVPSNLFKELKNKALFEINGSMIFILAKNIIFQLESWWAREVEKQYNYDHGIDGNPVLNQPYRGMYDAVLRHYVGVWEGCIGKFLHSESDVWEEFQKNFQLCSAYINTTAEMLIMCLEVGDKEASVWFADILQNWFGLRSDEIDKLIMSDLKTPDYIVSTCLDDSWETFVEKSRSNKPSRCPTSPKMVYCCILSNYWKDVRYIILYTLMQLSQKCTDTGVVVFFIIKMFFYGKRGRDGDDPYGSILLFKNYADVLKGFIRQIKSDKYYGLLNDFVRNLLDKSFEDRVQLRVYSITPADFSYFVEEQIVILCILKAKGECSSGDPSSFLNLSEDELDYVRIKFASFIEKIEQVKYTEWQNTVIAIDSSVTMDKFDDAKTKVRKDLSDILSSIN